MAEVPSGGDSDAWAAYSTNAAIRRMAQSDGAPPLIENIALIRVAPGDPVTVQMRLRSWSTAWMKHEAPPGTVLIVSSGIADQLISAGAADLVE